MTTPATARIGGRQTVSWFVFGLMASVTFVGLLSELLPSGVLPQMTDDLGVSESQVGALVGGYALASAIFAIPLVSATLAVNRKKLLMTLLIGFAVTNIAVALSSSYTFILACRILGGICAGVMWPMIAAYGTRLAPPHMHGKVITVIMSGNTLGISVGLPAMTTLGLTFGWRAEFMVLGLIVVAIAVLSHLYLPAVEGEKLSRSNSPLAVLRMPSMLIILLLTFLSVSAHYGIFTYITLLVELLDFAGGTGVAMLLFGVGSVISVVVSARFMDSHLRPMFVGMLALGGLSMAMLLVFRGAFGISHLAFFTWGLAFGPLVTLYQTAVSKQVSEARDVATSVASSVFNLSIMAATWVGGLMLAEFPAGGVRQVAYMSLGCFVAATAVALLAKRTLRS